MGAAASTDKNTASAVDRSSGFHFLEFHMPTAGIGIGAIVFIVLILAFIYYCRKFRSKRPGTSHLTPPSLPYHLGVHHPMQQFQLGPLVNVSSSMMLSSQGPAPIHLSLPQNLRGPDRFREAPNANYTRRIQEIVSPPEVLVAQEKPADRVPSQLQQSDDENSDMWRSFPAGSGRY
jgi:hypothetical protein